MTVNKEYVLVTGGAGYIGSHTTVDLLNKGLNVVLLDNLSNSKAEAVNRIQEIAERELNFVAGDIRDSELLDSLFSKYKVSCVIHFAGLKAVGESVKQPLMYFDNNVSGTINLIKAMSKAGVKRLVFSSSATVYGDAKIMPVNESQPTGQPANPYGKTKLIIEQILSDLVLADESWRVAVLRYFNPIGAHESGLIGEDPKGVPNNLLPFICQVASGKLKELSVYGDDYGTPDGTGVRDYIHVMDLASGHLKALDALHKLKGFNVWNLGTGNGYSVLEIVNSYQDITGCHIPYKVTSRRDGDIAVCYADPTKANEELGWSAYRTLHQMIEDTWRWQTMSPNGY